MIEPWIIVAVVYSFVAAAYIMTNDIFKIKGEELVFSRSLLATLMILPLALSASWPLETDFYVFAIVAALLAAIGDVVMFEAARHHGGSVLSRMAGFRPLVLFLLWPIFDSHAFDSLSGSPWIGAGIISCLIAMALAIFFARHNTLSRAALLAYLIPLFCFCLNDAMWKHVLSPGASTDYFIVLIFICALVMTLFSGGALLRRAEPIHYSSWLWPAIVNGLLFLAVVFIKAYGLSITANPAYFNAVVLVSVVWTYLAHRFAFKKPDTASPIAGFTVVAAAAVLTILVGMLPK